MKELLAVLAGFLVLAGAASLAVGTFGDRDLFVPPPDAVAEGFIRETLTGRYTRAKHALREPESVSEQDLRDLEKRIEADVKEASEIEASVVSRDDERALVTVRISSSEGSHAATCALGFDREWKITGCREY